MSENNKQENGWTSKINFVSGIVGGVLSIVIGQVVLNYIGLMTTYFGRPTVEQLDSGVQVLNKASEVINDANHTLVIATDFPATGVISYPDIFLKYTAALGKVQTKNIYNTYLWFPKNTEKRIAQSIETNIPAASVERAVGESDRIRAITNGSATEVNSPLLGYMNFWVSSSDERHYKSVIGFLDNPPQGEGFYTDSPEVGNMLIKLQKVIIKRAPLDKQFCDALYPTPDAK